MQRDAVDDRHVLEHHHPCQLVGKGDPDCLGQQTDAQAVVDAEDVLAGDGGQQPRLRSDAEDAATWRARRPRSSSWATLARTASRTEIGIRESPESRTSWT